MHSRWRQFGAGFRLGVGPALGLLLCLCLGLAACGGEGADASHPRDSFAAEAHVDSSTPDSGVLAEAAPPQGVATSADLGTGSGTASGAAPTVLCLGDSLTAGYGLAPEQAWPARLTARALQQGWTLEVVNAGLSGETTSGGLRRIDWLLSHQPPGGVAAVVVALGGNDGLRGVPLDTLEQNLDGILARVAAEQPDALLVLAGMQSPPNMGAVYTTGFKAVFPRVAARHDAALVPFLLEGVGGVPELNQGDGIHPTAAGQRILADNVWDVLEPLLATRFAPADAQPQPVGAGG